MVSHLNRLRRPVSAVAVVALCLLVGCLLASCVSSTPSSEQNAPLQNVSSDSETNPSVSDQPTSPEKAIKTGRDQVTVLVLNGCGIEGAAQKAADKLSVEGFANVTVDNAMSHNYPRTRVSYRYEEQRAEVDAIAALFEATGTGMCTVMAIQKTGVANTISSSWSVMRLWALTCREVLSCR